MAKKVSDSQVAGIKAHAEAKNKETMQYLDYLETHIINKCNLNCKGCSHFSNIVDDEDAPVDITVFEKDFARLSELFDHIFTIRLMGGEPFLNPDMGKYIEIVRKYFPKTDLRILTNGLLIPKTEDTILNSIAENGVVLDISCYPVTDRIRDQIESRLQMFGIQSNFSELVIDFHKRLNIQGNSEKYHSGGLWTNACCSHPRKGEILSDAVSRRLLDELGVKFPVQEYFDFVYRAEFANGITEYEYDHVLLADYCGDIRPNPEEIEELRWVDFGELKEELTKNPEHFTAWFIIAAPKVLKRLSEEIKK